MEIPPAIGSEGFLSVNCLAAGVTLMSPIVAIEQQTSLTVSYILRDPILDCQAIIEYLPSDFRSFPPTTPSGHLTTLMQHDEPLEMSGGSINLYAVTPPYPG